MERMIAVMEPRHLVRLCQNKSDNAARRIDRHPRLLGMAALDDSGMYDLTRLRCKGKGNFRCDFCQHGKYPPCISRSGSAVFQHLTGSIDISDIPRPPAT